jgi:hypothetical protein
MECLAVGNCTSHKDDVACANELKLKEKHLCERSRLLRAAVEAKRWLKPAEEMYTGGNMLS